LLRAIEKIPRTLATIGESLMAQTGWHITILAGGPSPSNGGGIMTYLSVKSSLLSYLTTHKSSRSHTGKTTGGDKFEKFLGPGDYDEHLLIPFERFLHESFCK
jgi:hypothetical protein